MLVGYPLHNLHNLLLLTDVSVKGWRAHTGDLTVSGMWSDTETSLHINVLELKAVFLVIKACQTHPQIKRVPVASDNATLMAYLSKEGRDSPRTILLRALHIQGCYYVIADSFSCRDKI